MVFVLVLEVCARVDDWLRWDAPFFDSYSHAILRTTDEHGRHTRPGARYEKWQINSQGFRGPEITVEKPPGVIRVVVAGASEAFGLYESSGMEFPALLQDMLNEESPGRYQVLNAACPGMTPARIAFYFNSWVSRFDPDILIFYPTPAFYLDVEPPPGPRDLLARAGTAASPDKMHKQDSEDAVESMQASPLVSEPSKPLPGVTARLRTSAETGFAWRPLLRLKNKVNAVRRRFLPQRLQTWARQLSTYRQLRRQPPHWVWSAPPPERLGLFKRHVAELIDLVQNHGTRVILATHGTRFGDSLNTVDKQHLIAWRRYYPRAGDLTLVDTERSVNALLRDMGRSGELVVADVEAAVSPTAEHYADFAHFTDTGSRLAAGVMARAVTAISADN